MDSCFGWEEHSGIAPLRSEDLRRVNVKGRWFSEGFYDEQPGGGFVVNGGAAVYPTVAHARGAVVMDAMLRRQREIMLLREMMEPVGLVAQAINEVTVDEETRGYLRKLFANDAPPADAYRWVAGGPDGTRGDEDES